jgi:flagellar operon protein
VSAPIDRMGGLSPLPPPVAPPPAAAPPAQAPNAAGGGVTAPSFAAQLRQSQSPSSGGVQFSKHALERLQRRGISAGSETLNRLQHGVDLAAGKGARDAVVMVDDTAFVVSVKNRTVITAIDSAHMRQHVFTNIDSAVLA